MELSYYQEGNERLLSVTGILDYTFGIAEEIERWTIKESVKEVQRFAKTLETKLTQQQAIEVGLAKHKTLLNSSRDIGHQVHQAVQAHNNGQSYDLDETAQRYFEGYCNFYNEHKITPILEEFCVSNFQYGYRGHLDFYGLLDGKKVIIDYKTGKSVRWTYGLQLAAYRKCLEDLGYPVDAVYVLHIKPRVRGGNPTAELHEYHFPFEMFKKCLELCRLKISNDPHIDWRERTDRAAIEKELQQEVVALPVKETGFVLSSDSQGQHRDIPASVAIHVGPSREQQIEALEAARLSLEDKSPHGQFVEQYLTDNYLYSNHMARQQEAPADETSSPQTEIQQGKLHAGEVIRFSGQMPRTIQDPSALPSAKDISAVPELDLDSSLGIQRKRRRSA